MGERLLEQYDVNLTVVESAEIAIEVIESGNTFDCVVTDFNLPDLNGDSVAHCVKDASPETPVVLISGNPRDDVFDTEIHDAFVSKPFDTFDLLNTIGRAVSAVNT